MTAKVTTAAKGAKPAKPAAAKKKKTVPRKSSKAGKHVSSKASAAASAKHQAHVKHEHHLHEEHLAHEAHLAAIGKKSLAAGDALPVCAFEALAMSLRLAGQFVHDDDVAHLWWLAGADPLGAAPSAALGAARLHGLAGFRPQAHRLVCVPEVGTFAQDLLALPSGNEEAAALGHLDDLFAGDGGLHGLNLQLSGRKVGTKASGSNSALILGIDAPGPHCVLATADGWWSWGELYSPWPCRVDQAWAVSWS